MSKLEDLSQKARAIGFDKGRSDPIWFAEHILGIRLNGAQKRWFRRVRPGTNGWEWRLSVMVIVAANQIGKTLGVGILILWACNYKIGVRLTDEEHWIGAYYQWFHLSPTQQQAYLPLKDIQAILRGNHGAQYDAATQKYRPCYLSREFVWDQRVEQAYDGLGFWNGAICQFRTTGDFSTALTGRRASGITFDEAAFEDHLHYVVEEVAFMRLISTSGPLFLISTPNGLNEFHDYAQKVLNEGVVVEDMVWETPSGWYLVWATISDNVGYGVSQEQVARMERDLDESTKEQQLRGAFLEPSEAFFAPIPVTLKAFRKIPEQEKPQPGHSYVLFWDPSTQNDPTAGVVLDVTTPIWRGVCLKYYRKPLGIEQLIVEMLGLHQFYASPGDTRVITGYDATSFGGAIFRQLLRGLQPQHPLNFAGPRAKIDALTNLKGVLQKGQLLIPQSWVVAQREILNYRLDDKKITNDIVSALSGAAQIAAKRGSGEPSRPFRVSGRVAYRAH